MPLHTIKAPVPFTGVGPGGLKFRTGRAQTDNEDLVGWFRAAGYIIDGLPPVPDALGSLAPPWAPDTAYDAGELVWRDGLLHRRKAAGTDGATFDPTAWDSPGSAATFVRTVNGAGPDEAGNVDAGSSRGDVVYLWDSGTATYSLAAGQSDDGVSPRCYRGGATGAPEAQTGYAARPGDWQIVTT